MGAFHNFEIRTKVHILLTILLIANIPPYRGQIMELPDSTNNATSNISPSPEVEQTFTPTELRICHPDDPLSNAFCKCEKSVVNCDFSNYSSTSLPTTPANATGNDTSKSSRLPSTEIELILYGYQFPPTTSRFCICNTPPNINLTFSKDHFLPTYANQIERFDLYNLPGVTKFIGGFNLNFHGDLYIANVSLIPDILAHEFGRGDEQPIQDWQNLKCCSPIQVNQQHKKPLLFIENTTIGKIHTRGMSDIHLWKTLIMKSVNVTRVETLGMIFDSYSGYNVAILGSRFENVSRSGFVFKDSSNLFMFDNYFKRSTSSMSWWSRSILNDSNILLMDNVFWNGIFMNMDATKVVSWFNIYDMWDNYTFLNMKYTSFSPDAGESSKIQRSISLRYNLVHKQFHLNNTLDFGSSRITLSDNVIGACNCSIFDINDELIKPEMNYCFTGSIAEDRNVKEKCSVKLDQAMKECKKTKENPRTDFSRFCESKKSSVPKFPGVGTNLAEDIDETRINSSFISLIVHNFQSSFGQNKMKIDKVVLTGGTPVKDSDRNGESQDDENLSAPIASGGESKSHHANKSSSPAVAIFITLIVIGSIIGLAFFGYKYRHRLIRRGGGHEILDGSQETFI